MNDDVRHHFLGGWRLVRAPIRPSFPDAIHQADSGLLGRPADGAVAAASAGWLLQIWLSETSRLPAEQRSYEDGRAANVARPVSEK